MKTQLNAKRHTWKILFALFLGFLVTLINNSFIVLALPPGETESQTRAEMMSIAHAHAHYLWQNTATHILHRPPVFTIVCFAKMQCTSFWGEFTNLLGCSNFYNGF